MKRLQESWQEILSREPDADGRVARALLLNSERLKFAYQRGVFPWVTHEDGSCDWFSLDPRGVLEFDRLKLSRSDLKLEKRHPFQVTFDRAFEHVLRACALVPRKGQWDSWITTPFYYAYLDLHREGLAHSVEVWNRDRLVGGLYGVLIEGVFSGESMFHLESGAGKIALLSVIRHLQRHGHKWIDTQMVTELVAQWGGREIPRKDFLEKLKADQTSEPLRAKWG